MPDAPDGGQVAQAEGKPRGTRLGWLGQHTYFLGFCLALAAVVGLAYSPLAGQGWSFIKGDHGRNRWHSLKASTQSECYLHLWDPLPRPYAECVHPTDASIPRMPTKWNAPHLSVYSVAPTPRALPTLRDLGDRGQEEAIRFLENNAALKTKAWIDLQDALNYSATSDTGEKDPFRFDRVLVATVAKGLDWNPGDRMMWTRIFVQPINFAFAGYSVAATDSETVKIASLEIDPHEEVLRGPERDHSGNGGGEGGRQRGRRAKHQDDRRHQRAI